MSSKRASRRRRQAARDRKYARLRKLDRVPKHTGPERLRAAAARAVAEKHEQELTGWKRKAAGLVMAGVGAITLTTGTPAVSATAAGHSLYRYEAISAAGPFIADHPDPPHTPEAPGTYWPGYEGSGTAVTTRWFRQLGPGVVFPPGEVDSWGFGYLPIRPDTFD